MNICRGPTSHVLQAFSHSSDSDRDCHDRMRDLLRRFGAHCASSPAGFKRPIAKAIQVAPQFAVAASSIQFDPTNQATIASAPWLAVSRIEIRTAWSSPFTVAVTRDGCTMKITTEHECSNGNERVFRQRVQSNDSARVRQLRRHRSRTVRHSIDVFTRRDRRVANAADRATLDGKACDDASSVPALRNFAPMFFTRSPCIPSAIVALSRRVRASSRRSEPRNECSTRP